MESIEILDLHDYKNILDDSSPIQKLLSKCFDNNIVVRVDLYEFRPEFLEFLKKNDHELLHLIVCGGFNYKFKNAKVFTNYRYLYELKQFYKNKIYLLEELNFKANKEQYFDALLGVTFHNNFIRKNRIFVKNFIEENNLLDKVILKYFETKRGTIDILDKQEKEEFDIGVKNFNIDKLKNLTYTVEEIEYEGEQVKVSHIIPVDIYNKTTYSIVAETIYENEYSFFTEKTYKPILSKRLFIHFAGQYHLKNLRDNYGFRTFDGIIDESYDNIEDQNERWKQAAQQVLFLISQPQEQILEQIFPIIEYNFNHAMSNFNWLHHYEPPLPPPLS